MGADNRGIDHGVFVVRLVGEVLENLLPPPAFAPSHMPRIDHPKIAKARWQVPSEHPRPVPVQHDFPNQPVILRRATRVALPARQEVLNPFPLLIPQRIVSCHTELAPLTSS